MLFTFNYFWRSALIVVLSWIFYALLGYEITIVTILALILCFLANK